MRTAEVLSSPPRRADQARWRVRRLIALVVAVLLPLGLVGPAQAYAPDARIDLKVLVVTDGRPNVEAITAQLDREGVPYEQIDTRQSNRPVVSPAYLSGTVSGQPHAKYQAVVLAHEAVLPAGELTALADFERRFGIRRLNAYTWAHPGVGLNPAGWSGAVDGLTATVTPQARAAGFGYLAGTVGFDDIDGGVQESYAVLANPVDTAFTPYLTLPVPGGDPASPATVLGVYAHDQREEMVMTVSLNQHQTHARILAHGVVQWLTRGVRLGLWRNWFSVHIDDVLLPDNRWHTEADCTVGDNCNPERDPAVTPYNTLIRMTAADTDALLAWQRANGLKLDMVFNGQGAVDAGSGDPLTARLLANRTALRWVNHTYGHPHLGCVQDFTVSPWRCATDPATGAVRYVSRAVIQEQISRNVDWARRNRVSLDATELVTGEHSGLRSLPQMPTDNPNLAPALTATGIRTVASDASREAQARMIGSARTVPRHPMNIFYNVATRAEEVDEYNWIYTRAADGGSGICEANPTTSTCITPLAGPSAYDTYIVPIEARIAFGHVVGNDPRPHYAHQSNLAEDRILYPVLDAVLARYRALYAGNTPLVNPTMSAAAEQLRRADAWRTALASGGVEAFLSGGRVTVVNRTGARLHVPVTAPEGTEVVTVNLLGLLEVSGPYGEQYGGVRSAWTSVASGGRLLLRVPAA